MHGKASAPEHDSNDDSSDSSTAKPRRRRKKKNCPIINLSNCKYPVVAEAAESLGWNSCCDDDGTTGGRGWDVFWTDMSVASERIMRLHKYQRINHFPGMYQICRKGDLARSIHRMARHFGRAFNFIPRTWVLPESYSLFKAHLSKCASRKRPVTYIIKPVASCQGKGIFLTRSWQEVSPVEPVVAQQYMGSPLLIDGFKFDLRIYVLVTSCGEIPSRSALLPPPAAARAVSAVCRSRKPFFVQLPSVRGDSQAMPASIATHEQIRCVY